MRHSGPFLLSHLVFVLLLAVGLQTSLADIREVFRRFSLIARTALVIDFGVPLAALLLAALLPLSARSRQLLVLMAACPGAVLLPRRQLFRAYLPGVLVAVVSVIALLSVPLWSALSVHFFGSDPLLISPREVGRIALHGMLAPLLIGLVMRQLLPAAAMALARIADLLYKVILAAAVLSFLYRGDSSIWRTHALGIIAMVLVAFAAAAMGHWAGGPVRAERNLTATLAAEGNPALALAILSPTLADPQLAGLVAAFLLARAVALVPYRMWRRTLTPAGSPPARGAPAGAHRSS